MTTIPLNATALDVAPTRRELREFTTGVLHRDKPWRTWVGLTLLGVVATALVSIIPYVVLLAVVVGSGATSPLLEHAVLLSVGTGACLVATVFLAVARTQAHDVEESFRLHRFAAANGFDFAAEVVDPDLPGVIFDRGTQRKSSARLRRPGAQPLEVANFRSWIQKGRAGEGFAWSYLALTVPEPLPAVVLAAPRHARRLLRPDQTSALVRSSGPWGEEFQLFCHGDAEPWARALFTPDMIARFRGAPPQSLVVETIGNRVFVYSPHQLLASSDPATWRWIVETADALSARIAALGGPTSGTGTGTGTGTTVASPVPDDLRTLTLPPLRERRRRRRGAALLPLVVLVGIWAAALTAL